MVAVSQINCQPLINQKIALKENSNEEKAFLKSNVSFKGELEEDTIEKTESDNVEKADSKKTDSENSEKIDSKKAEAPEFHINVAAKNFIKGLTSPITQIFESPANALMTAGTAAMGAILLKANKKIASALISFTFALGLFEGGKGVKKILETKDNTKREEAFTNLGTGTFLIGASVLTASSAIVESGATAKAIPTIPISEGSNLATSVINNLKIVANSAISLTNKLLSTDLGKCVTDTPQAIWSTVKTLNSKQTAGQLYAAITGKAALNVAETVEQLPIKPPTDKILTVETLAGLGKTNAEAVSGEIDQD